MIGIDGQYIASFSIGDKKDFIQRSELIQFSIIEEAGNQLPTFELDFNSRDAELESLLNEGANLLVQFGRSLDSLEDIELKITKSTILKAGQGSANYDVKGMLSALPFISDSEMVITEPMSGVEAVIQTVSNYFEIDSNITKSNDLQRWIQYNNSDKVFVNDVLMHSYLLNSFIACAVTIDGKFRIRDVKKDLARKFGKKYDWKFTPSPTEDTDIAYNADPIIEQSTGFINSWIGYGREKLLDSLEAGTQEFILERAQPIAALTKELARDSSVTKRFAAVGAINDNVHKNYWKAYYQNLVNLAAFSSVKLTLAFGVTFQPLRCLDLVMFNDKDYGKTATSEYRSGLYYVAKVARTISNEQISTVVVLVRESMNQVYNA